MKNFVKQTFSFALIFFSFFACKEGEFSNQSKNLELVEYKANTRSFIPYYRVGISGEAQAYNDGTTYAGDNRGFSSKDDELAKLYHEVGFDLDNPTRGVSINAWCSAAKKYNENNELVEEDTAEPYYRFTSKPKAIRNGSSTILTFGTYAKASNPLLAISPNVEVNSYFTIEENKEEQYLKLTGKIKVDEFPSTEAYIKDPGGNIVLIGVNPCKGGPINIWAGWSQEIVFDFKIITDSSGYFREVEDEYGYRKSIYSWNSDFENKRAYN